MLRTPWKTMADEVCFAVTIGKDEKTANHVLMWLEWDKHGYTIYQRCHGPVRAHSFSLFAPPSHPIYTTVARFPSPLSGSRVDHVETPRLDNTLMDPQEKSTHKRGAWLFESTMPLITINPKFNSLNFENNFWNRLDLWIFILLKLEGPPGSVYRCGRPGARAAFVAPQLETREVWESPQLFRSRMLSDVFTTPAFSCHI